MQKTTMRAARYYGKEDIRIEHDVPIAECGPDQIRVNRSLCSYKVTAH